MNSRQPSLVDRLEAIVAELECHFHYLLNDVRDGVRPDLAEGAAVVAQMEFATKCVCAAVRALRDEPIATIVAE